MVYEFNEKLTEYEIQSRKIAHKNRSKHREEYQSNFKLTECYMMSPYLSNLQNEFYKLKAFNWFEYKPNKHRGRPKKYKGEIYDASCSDLNYIKIKVKFNQKFFSNIMSMVKDYVTYTKPEDLSDICYPHILANVLVYRDLINMDIMLELEHYDNRLKRDRDPLGVKHFLYTNIDCCIAIDWSLKVYFEKGLHSMRNDGYTFFSSMLGNLNQMYRSLMKDNRSKNKNLRVIIKKFELFSKFTLFNLPKKYKDMFLDIYQKYPDLYHVEVNILKNFKRLTYTQIQQLAFRIQRERNGGCSVKYPNGWSEELVFTILKLFSREEYEMFSGLKKVNKVINDGFTKTGKLSSKSKNLLNKHINKLDKITETVGGYLPRSFNFDKKLSGQLQIHESKMAFNSVDKSTRTRDFLNQNRLNQIKDVLKTVVSSRKLNREQKDLIIEHSCNIDFLKNALGKELGFADMRTRLKCYYNELNDFKTNQMINDNSKDFKNKYELFKLILSFETGVLKSSVKLEKSPETDKSTFTSFCKKLKKFDNKDLEFRKQLLKLSFYIYSYYYYFIYNGYKFSSYSSFIHSKSLKSSLEDYNKYGFIPNQLKNCRYGFEMSGDFKEFYPKSGDFEFDY